MDSSEAPSERRRRRDHKRVLRGLFRDDAPAPVHQSPQQHRAKRKPVLTLGNIVHFIIAVFFLWPLFVLIAAIWSLSDAVNCIRHTIEAIISSTFWTGRLCKEWIARSYLHPNDPKFLKIRGARRAFGHEAAKDWKEAGLSLVAVTRAWSKTFGLGGLFTNLEDRVQRANQDWRRYAWSGSVDEANAPSAFPDQFVVVDELEAGGSTARLFVVRRRDDPDNGPLYVLKYFNLRAGAMLESVIREKQAVELAKRLGLIIESELGDNNFWYVMPYYRGETLTQGVLRNIRASNTPEAKYDHQRLSLGYVHQLLQIIAQYHEAGVIHKDIKPDNLIINDDRIYLVDIGLMTPLSSMAQLTTHGTEYFRDPEMVRLALEGREVREVDATKFDVYSIGAVLFFALSGEFPTSGALSRLPNDVPLAAQFVVNRAMTSMQQRYDNARAMLTDVDYLCWAASQGTLDQVKPADLPSFRGMPVPEHLVAAEGAYQPMQGAPMVSANYSAWYSAPYANRPQKRSWLKRVAIATVFMGVLFACFAVVTGGAIFISEANRSGQQTTTPDTDQHTWILDRIDPNDAQQRSLYTAISEGIADGIDTRHQTIKSRPVDQAPNLVADLDLSLNTFEQKANEVLKNRKAPATLPDRQFIFISDGSQAATSFQRDLRLEFARKQWDVLPATKGLSALLATISDPVALHREIATRFASQGRLPAYIAYVSADNNGTLHVRVLFPSKEWTYTIIEK